MYVLTLARPLGHLIASGQANRVFLPFTTTFRGEIGIRNSDDAGLPDDLQEHLEDLGADLGPSTNVLTTAPGAIVALASVLLVRTVVLAPALAAADEILYATSTGITEYSPSAVRKLLGMHVLPYTMLLGNVRPLSVSAPVPVGFPGVVAPNLTWFSDGRLDELVRTRAGVAVVTSAPTYPT